MSHHFRGRAILVAALAGLAGWACGRAVPYAWALGECDEEDLIWRGTDFLLALRSDDPDVLSTWPTLRVHGPLVAEGAETTPDTVVLVTLTVPLVLRLTPVSP